VRLVGIATSGHESLEFAGRSVRADAITPTVLPPSAGRVEHCAVRASCFLDPMGIVHVRCAMTILDSAMRFSAAHDP